MTWCRRERPNHFGPGRLDYVCVCACVCIPTRPEERAFSDENWSEM